MITILKSINSKLENKFISNPNYLLLLAFFNCAILLNFHKMLWRNPPLLFVFFCFVLLSFINYKYWWATIINVLISFYILANQFPRQANHANIEFFIEIVIILIFIYKAFYTKFKIPPDLLSSFFRIMVVAFYFYTGFHKLNTDFFNPCVSCVNEVNEYILENFFGRKIILPSSFSVFFQYATIVLEMILPFGLLWHKTRKYTAIVLVTFHCYLNFAVYVDFSAIAAFLILGCVLNFEESYIKAPVLKSLRIYIFICLLSLFVKLLMIEFKVDLFYLGYFYGLVFNVGWLIFFFTFFKNYEERILMYDKKYNLVVISGLLLISFWTLKTYIGLGNAGNFTMFSNLLTEKTRGNHLIIDTKKTKLYDFEEDTVLILKLHDTLKKEKLENYKLPIIEFKYLSKRWCEKFPDLKINATVVYKKDTLTITDLRKTAFTNTKWWYKYVFFRKIQPQGPSECIW